ncbi:MAG TPA: hypothetical protein VM032_18265 [Vicinamibacterales bacterium]|nr:hypothetical protein [Vicinamibacterales bacterium]
MNTPRERDRVLDQWLRRSRLEPDTVADACLDAETAAAWVDGALDGQRLDDVQVHVADCARCQALMASLASTTPAKSGTAALPDTSSWRRWLTWAVPMTAAATALIAVVVWLNAPESQPFRAAEQKERAADTPERGSDNAANPEAAAKGRPVEALRAADADRRHAAAAATPADAAAPPVTAQGAAPPARSSAPPAAPPAASAAAPAAAPAEPTSLQRARVAQLDAATAASTARETTPAPLVVSTPSSLVRWRVTGALVERTVDGGVTWAASPTGLAGSFLAGDAPSAEVCWLVGAAGSVALTVDGASWSQVPFPEPIDLSGVAAVDERSAIITAADGRVFSTADAGRTWRRSR